MVRASTFLLLLLTKLDGTVTLMILLHLAYALDLETRYILLLPGVVSDLFALEAVY